MKVLFLLLLSVFAVDFQQAWCQDDIQSILERDPFDPDRGKKEEEEIVDEEEPLLPPQDLPILEGTIIVGQTRIAMFSFMDAGKKVSVHAVFKESESGYMLFTSKGSEEGEEVEAEPTKSYVWERNGKIAGYTVSRVERDFVEFAAKDEPIPPIKLYDGRKENRGGSAKLPQLRRVKPEAPVALGVSEENKDTKGTAPNQTNDGDRKPQFRRREDRQLSPTGQSKVDSAKRKM